MKNKVDIKSAKTAAECVRLRLDASDYRGFSHVADFAAEAESGNGELICRDSIHAVSADALRREDSPQDGKKRTAAELAKAVMNGERSACSIAEEYLSRAEADTCNAYITVMRHTCEETAKEVDRRVAKGEYLPLAGVPLSVKDNICTAGTRTTCASKSLLDFVPSYSATVYERLISAGAIPVGKTNLDEFAVGSDGGTSYFGKCLNPLNPSLTPGGSSAGSAASLAENSAVISLGSDTGGSARIPASYCGLTALKPTYGTMSRYGLVGMAPSLEQICPMARSVAPLRTLFEIASGRDFRDMTTLVENEKKEKHGKLGVFLPLDASPAAKAAVDAAVSALTAHGYTAQEITLPYYDRILDIYYTISSAEAASNLARYDGLRYGYSAVSGDVTDARSESLGVRLRERLAEGAYVLTYKNGGAYTEALSLRESIKTEFARLFSHYDMLVTPMSQTEATCFNLAECAAERFAVYANLTGVPAITLPAACGEKGLPVGVQLMGNLGCDAELISAAEKVEEEIKW